MLIVFCDFMKNYYQILEIQAGAPKEVIKAAYRALVKKYHPDNYSGDINVANEKLRELSEAYEVLIDESKRREYDRHCQYKFHYYYSIQCYQIQYRILMKL